MSISRREFSLAEGLAYQAKHVAEWKLKLNDVCYKALCDFVEDQNKSLVEGSTGYDVCRGVDLDNFINNWKP